MYRVGVLELPWISFLRVSLKLLQVHSTGTVLVWSGVGGLVGFGRPGWLRWGGVARGWSISRVLAACPDTPLPPHYTNSIARHALN